MSVAVYAIERVPDAEDLDATMGTAQQTLERVYGLYLRIMAWLALIAEEVESVAGLPPLPSSPEELEETESRL